MGSEGTTWSVGFPEGKAESLLLEKSQVWYLDRTFYSTYWLFEANENIPVVRVNDIVDRLDQEIKETNVDANNCASGHK